eukprot:353022_1
MNVLRRTGYRAVHRGYYTGKLINTQTRKVSKQVWDTFGFLKDGTDYYKRNSCAWYFHEYPKLWRVWLWGLMCVPATFLFWAHGGFDYVFRRRNIPPIPVDYDAEYPWRAPEGYVNPLFTPAKKWQKIREEKRKKLEENKFNRPFYFKKVTKRSRFHKYREGGR